MITRRVPVLLIPLLVLAGCGQPQKRANLNYDMGERVEVGSLTYVVVENSWQTQIGEGIAARSPKDRFLVLTLSATNGGGTPRSIPLLSLEGAGGQVYQEIDNAGGVTNWLGILRSVEPAQTLQGRVVFDVPLGAYRLRLPDVADSGYEQFAMVDIPLRIDSGQVQAPLVNAVK